MQQICKFLINRRCLSTVVKQSYWSAPTTSYEQWESSLDRRQKETLQYLKAELEIFRSADSHMPFGDLRVSQWIEVLKLSSRQDRITYYWKIKDRQLFNEGYDKVKSIKADERLLKWGSPKKNSRSGDMDINSLWNKTIFLRLENSQRNCILKQRAAHALCLPDVPKILLDCTSLDRLYRRHLKATARSLHKALFTNCTSGQPFSLTFTNIDKSGEAWDNCIGPIRSFHDYSMRRSVTTHDFFTEATEASFTDLYPREKLVYLTERSRDSLTKFDSDTVYIVGCSEGMMTSFDVETAKRYGIRTAKLPFDDFVRWRIGSKCMSIPTVLAMLRSVYMDGDWLTAILKHVSRHQLKDYYQVAEFAGIDINFSANDRPNSVPMDNAYPPYPKRRKMVDRKRAMDELCSLFA